jgi:uncharacterized protein YbjT (DUF2867 family)
MTMLVAGATGRIGGVTLDALLVTGHEPFAMIRRADRAAALSTSLLFRVANFSAPATLPAAFETPWRRMIGFRALPTQAHPGLS